MQKILIIMYLLSMILLADLQEEENLEMKNIYKEMIDDSIKVLNKSDSSNNMLILALGTKENLLASETSLERNEKFKKGRESFKEELDIEQLSDFYVDALEGNKEFVTMWQLLVRLDDEQNVLYYLKEDLEKNSFSLEETQQLLENIKPLLFLDNKCIYDLIEAKNKFFAKHTKKYIYLTLKKPNKYFAFNENSYEDFLYYLNEGESLLSQSIRLNDYTLLTEFVEKELRLTKEEKSAVKKSLREGSLYLYTAYWIRVWVYTVYALNESSYLSLINKIEKQKTFFDELSTSVGSVD